MVSDAPVPQVPKLAFQISDTIPTLLAHWLLPISFSAGKKVTLLLFLIVLPFPGLLV